MGTSLNVTRAQTVEPAAREAECEVVSAMAEARSTGESRRDVVPMYIVRCM